MSWHFTVKIMGIIDLLWHRKLTLPRCQMVAAIDHVVFECLVDTHAPVFATSSTQSTRVFIKNVGKNVIKSFAKMAIDVDKCAILTKNADYVLLKLKKCDPSAGILFELRALEIHQRPIAEARVKKHAFVDINVRARVV